MNKKENSVFEKVVLEYNKNAPDGLKTWNIKPGVEQIRFKEWRTWVHYEFYDYKRVQRRSYEIGVEIHLEDKEVAFLSDALFSFKGMQILETGEKAKFNCEDPKKYGRIVLKFSYNEPAEKIANAMRELIIKTKYKIDEEVKKFRSIQISWNLAIKLEEKANKTGQSKNKIVEKALTPIFKNK